MKYLPILLILLSSCTTSPTHVNPSVFFKDKLSYGQIEEPVISHCPICKENGKYIQTIISERSTNFYSQYVCTNNHEWLIKHVDIQTATKQIIILR